MDTNNCSSDDSTDDDEVNRDFESEAQLVIDSEIVPKKSTDRYNLVYQTFLNWMSQNKANSFEESILICYFKDLQKRVSPATSWSVWSMLKKMLNVKHSVDISNYLNLKCILKNNSKGYKPKKSLTFSWDQIMEFMKNASDEVYLGAKILLIFGICGALRCCEFSNIKSCHVEDLQDKYLVTVVDTKTYIDRTFIIGPLFYGKVKDYIALRPTDKFSDKFFIQHINGKCTRQVMGKNKIGSVPSMIATYLNLDNAFRYTGHCFRRTAATLLSNSGANMVMIKQLGGWKSDSVASGYIADSVRSKNLIYQGITHENVANEKSNMNLLDKPSTSNSSHLLSFNDANQIQEVSELQLTFEDFNDSPEAAYQEPNNQDLSTIFKTANGKKLSPVVPQDENKNPACSKLFTSKKPIKVTFAQGNGTKLTDSPNNSLTDENLNHIPPKRLKISESSSTDAQNTVLKENVHSTKNSVVKFENCVINGNISNYYYYYGNNNK